MSLTSEYLVCDRKTTPTRTYELRWEKAYGAFWTVVTLTADGVWLSEVSCSTEHEARRVFERISE